MDLTPEVKKSMNPKAIILLLDIVLFFILLAVLPFDPKANKGLALLAFVAVLWLTEALHVTITALIVPLLAIGLGLVSTKEALVAFADPIRKKNIIPMLSCCSVLLTARASVGWEP